MSTSNKKGTTWQTCLTLVDRFLGPCWTLNRREMSQKERVSHTIRKPEISALSEVISEPLILTKKTLSKSPANTLWSLCIVAVALCRGRSVFLRVVQWVTVELCTLIHIHSPSPSHALSSPILNLLWHDECSILVVWSWPQENKYQLQPVFITVTQFGDFKVFLREESIGWAPHEMSDVLLVSRKMCVN